ncbi:GntR family transcriptional regulator [Nonomuraea sediminis]|uniref:GntR family transcriptional regulator n=1 Tax=Nonomuraea sediminis TaxID=2835864 RepID=UPI001BDCC375|nr:GntR family transcriptional regulator [Nonomuraea sediminis]
MNQEERPRYLRIADELAARIAKGELREGDKLPSIPQLTRDYGVSANTAQAVIRTLVSDGLAVAKSGSGTYVRKRAQVRQLVRSWNRNARGGSPFAGEMATQGRIGSWDYDSRTAQAPAEVRERLGLDEPSGDEPDVVRTDYVFRGDGEPVMLSTAWEPLAITRGTPIVLPEDGPHAGQGVVERMRQIGINVTHAAEAVSARPATAGEARQLDIAAGAILLTITRTYYADTQPVETAHILIPTDQYQVVYGTSIWDEPPPAD